MPFLKEYGLETYPFGLTPNIDLYFASPESESLIAAMLFALSRGDGLMKVVGEVGTGKTLMSRLLLSKLPIKDYNTAYINAPVHITPQQLPQLLVTEFGIKSKKGDDPIMVLQAYLLKEHAKGKRNVIILDEAQALGEAGLEAVRLLTNLETETDKLLQIVLFGQSELDSLLHKTTMRQLLQRVGFGFVMKPFAENIVNSYIHHRLDRCAIKTKTGRKKKGSPSLSYSPKACRMISRLSKGLPRLIHLLADKSLLAAYVDGGVEILPHHVNIAAYETAGVSYPWRFVYRYF